MKNLFTKLLGIIILIFTQCDILSPDNEKDTRSYDLHYIISGGFAGILNETTVDSKGFSQLTDRNGITLVCQLPDSTLNALKKCIKNSCFFLLKNNYETDSPWADGFQYQITVTQGGIHKSVQTIDGAEIPDQLKSLQECLHDINDIIRENGEEIASE